MKGKMNPYWGACTIDLTENCNLACDYCFCWRNGTRPEKVITEEMGKRIIDTFFNNCDPSHEGETQISWWGGEPLMEWKLLKKLTYYAEQEARERGIRNLAFGGTTNGLLYTPEKYEWLMEHKSVMLVSLDGIQPAHDMHRKRVDGTGSWKVVDRNLRSALKVIPWQRIRFSVSAETAQYFYDSIKYFVEDLGITNLAFSAVFESNWTDEAWNILTEQFDMATDYAIKKAREGSPIVLKHLNDEALMNNRVMGIQNPCGAGGNYIGWSIDGYAYPCHRFNKHNQTIKERASSSIPIASIYDGFLNGEWRKSFYQWKDAPPEICLECPIFRKSTCNGGCYAVNFDLTGSIKTPHPSLCKYNKIQHEAGLRYRKKADEAGIKILSSGWGENIPPENEESSCVCYNMCYNEGTSKEISHVDYNSDIACLCYNAAYNGESEPQHCVINHEKERLKKKFIGLSKKIIETKDNEKTIKQSKLENNILQKTIEML